MRELIILFLRLGFTAFGGPAAHIAMYQDEVVKRRGWMSEQHFLDLLGATNLIPGPNSTEMVMHIGYEREGWRGLIVAGLCFILPATFIVGLLAWLYVQYGTTPNGTALMYGIAPVVVVIVLQAILTLGRKAAKNSILIGLGVVCLVLYLVGINELLLLFGAGALYYLFQRVRGSAPLFVLPTIAGGSATLWQLPTAPDLLNLFLVFLKAGGLLYGSGYVLLAFLRNDLVVRLGWLTDQQLLDAIAIGQVTPGPVFTTATFVGYLLLGIPGAIVATIGIFLPSFFFVALLNPLMPRLRSQQWTSILLDGINAGSIGLMSAVGIQLGQAALIDIPTILIAVVGALLLWRTSINSTWLVLGGGAVGLIAGAMGWIGR
jgi:chromate transporter